MSLPFVDPSLPSNATPVFSDTTAARGDHFRANNSAIWGNLSALDARDLLKAPIANPAFTGGVQYPVWVTGIAYIANQMILRGYTIYICTTNHTAGTFITDFLTSGYWIPIADYPGIVKPLAGTIIPTGFLLCNGASLSRTDYPDLFAIIGVTWGNVDGSHFNLPNLGGATLGGVGTSSWGTQPETYTLAEQLNDEMQGHDHDTNAIYLAGSGPINFSGGSGYSVAIIGDPISDGVNGTPRIGNVTRGKIIGINFIIKVL